MNCAFLLIVLLGTTALFVETEARGGRGRGGGSIGGLFGGWRKFKKPASSGNSRRIMNGSPMHTAITNSASSASGSPSKSIKSATTQKKLQTANYPKQQMPAGYPGYQSAGAATGMGSGYPNAGYGSAGVPPAYYPNTAALPAGAVYYPQGPMGSSGSGNFLMGMMTGHMLNNMLFGRPHHITHIYHAEQQSTNNNSGNPQVVVINGNEAATANSTDPTHYWPTERDVPLASFNTSLTPPEAMVTETPAIFQRSNNDLNTRQPTVEPTTPTATAAPAPGSIICFPIMVNETDPKNSDTVIEVQKIVCFTAPLQQPHAECITRNYTVPDPADPTKTIEMQRQECRERLVSTTTAEPRIVAGDIGEGEGSASDGVQIVKFVPDEDFDVNV